jgi:hypothetical protein
MLPALPSFLVRLSISRAIVPVVSRWLTTAAVRVRSRVWSSGICGGRSGTGAGFLRVLRFPLPIFIPPNSPSSYSPGASYNSLIIGRHAKWTQLDSTPPLSELIRLSKKNYIVNETHTQCRNYIS